MKIENKNENIEMNINIKKDKFDNWDIINYVQDYIDKYKKEIAELEEYAEKDLEKFDCVNRLSENGMANLKKNSY
jgi:hypothetical protein